PKIRILAEHQGFWLKEKLLDFKASLVGQFEKFLPPDEAALASGITLGVQSGFTKEFKSQMSLAGTTHLVALSGYNITILVLAVAAFAMPLADPTVLAFNVGFQLSFLSLLGIVYLAPALRRIFRVDEKNSGGIVDTVMMTLSAQLAVMPLLVSTFGQFSLTAI